MRVAPVWIGLENRCFSNVKHRDIDIHSKTFGSVWKRPAELPRIPAAYRVYSQLKGSKERPCTAAPFDLILMLMA